MKKLLLSGLICLTVALSAQQMRKPSAAVISTLPAWAQEMYSEQPNMKRTDSLYNDYYLHHPFIKNYHTSYYRFWRKENAAYMNDEGYIEKPSPESLVQARNQRTQSPSTATSTWNLIGPFTTWNPDGSRATEQVNVYCIDACLSNPNVVYCGTEPGEVYKSVDGGTNWSLITLQEPMNGGVTAIAVAATDANNVYAGSGSFLYHSTDGGLNWNISYTSNGLGVNEILIHPANANVVLIATNKGFYKTTNGGTTWTQIYSQACYDVKLRPGTPDVVYLVKNNPAQDMCEFFLSSDTGSTFTQQTNGWYTSNDPARSDGGARIAVSAANPLKVYAYLIGQSKPNDFGYIGVYRSDDGGVTWTLPNGPAGGPYTTAHPNLAYGEPNWTYDQGFYNCAIMANPADADEILIGGLNLWRSDDGGATFSSVAGYIGGPLNMHVDMQDFRATPTGCWITNDGGVNFSTDFYRNDHQLKMDGIHGSEFWGFGTGWNEDVMVGGLYHNGTIAHHEGYGSGTFLELGGAEPASGYVNPGENTKVYTSELGAVKIPTSLPNALNFSSVGLWPNESYWAAESSEMEFDPRCYNIVYVGNSNKLYRSTDAGASYNLVYTFGTNANARLSFMEISWSNPNVMYVVQRPASGNIGKLWKTTDGGVTWTQLTIPAGNSARILITLSPEDENKIWMAYPGGANGQETFYSSDGGTTWSNISSPSIDNQEARWIQHVAGTNGGVYYFTATTAYYRNDTSTMWIADNSGLPAYLNTLYGKPFYRDGKIRVSSYGRGVWESSFHEAPSRIVAQPMVDKLDYTINCSTDTFYFEDHSTIQHTGATWQWSFPGGNPTSSTLRNPKVVYSAPGTYVATLIVTDGQNRSDTGSITINISAYQLNTNLSEGFQGTFPPAGWWNTGNYQWSLSTAAGSYGASSQSTIFDNYTYDAGGESSDLSIRADMTQQPVDRIKFDYAYAEYGFPYSDTLEVLVSTDCGQTYTSLWRKGGSQLATAPSNQNNTFVPTAAQWATDSVNLSAYSNVTDLQIVFRNHGHWGQAMYVDNINLGIMSTIQDPVNGNGYAHLSPNPYMPGAPLVLNASSQEVFLVEIFDVQGKLVHREQVKAGQSVQNGPQFLSRSVYFYRLTGETMIRTGKIVTQ